MMANQIDDNKSKDVRPVDDNVKYHPFNIQWLDSSYQQSCLPDSPWQKVSTKKRIKINV